MNRITERRTCCIRLLALAAMGMALAGAPASAQQLGTGGAQPVLADTAGDAGPSLDGSAGSERPASLAQVPIVEVGPIELRTVEAEDVIREAEELPPRFAIPHAVTVTPATDGLWQTLPDGRLQWRLRVSAPGARSINLGFERYHMPLGGQLHLYSADGSYRIRPFTKEDNQDHGQLWSPVILSDEMVIELVLPDQAAADALDLHLTSINYGYRGFGPRPAPDEPGAPRSGSCNVDVVCPEGDLWWNEIPAVAVISTGGSTFCTGFMVNNTSNDGTPYFMTASHCGITSGNAGSLVTYWNYHTSVCGGTPNGSLSQFNTGSTWRAGYSASDFTLVQLNSSPNPAWGITFAGWDRTSGNPSSAIAIHHPSTDEKRISFENQATTTTTYLGTATPGDGTHIRITDWDVGTTEGGSSGSPLFSPGHRVIGQLHGGYASCTSQTSDWYGRFSVSWTGGGASSSRLSNWLDPTSTGQTTLNTLVPGGSAVCGNGVTEYPETCDDGNTTPGDGCDEFCQVEPVCGNGVIEPGESCDDGNTTPGDGCDEFCQVEPGAGDECITCMAIGEGSFGGTTADNTGSVNDTSCAAAGDTIDEWYCYTASCTGTATASLCGSGFDTSLAVFDACGGGELACNDDSCSLQSQVSWATAAGTTYFVRVSGYNGATGSYTLVTSCSPSVCPDATITVDLITDNYGSETTWQVVEQGTGTVMGSGGPYASNTTYSVDVCVTATGCYDFTILDSYGDGICCAYGTGSYTVSFNGIPAGSGGEFLLSETVANIGGCGGCPDADGDGVCDAVDICPGYDDNLDTDGDGVPDGCDPCPLDNPDDSDGDGICNSVDPCPNRKAGDVNGDTYVDVGDVSDFTAVLLDPGTATPDAFCAANVNGDTTVDGQDIQAFLDLLLP